jgi:hypothetical protein
MSTSKQLPGSYCWIKFTQGLHIQMPEVGPVVGSPVKPPTNPGDGGGGNTGQSVEPKFFHIDLGSLMSAADTSFGISPVSFASGEEARKWLVSKDSDEFRSTAKNYVLVGFSNGVPPTAKRRP